MNGSIKTLQTLTSSNFSENNDPFGLFSDWLADAEAAEINDPNGMALATVDADGLPDVRMVLLKSYDPQGFVFFTNEESAKGRQLAEVAKAGLLFHWKSLRRQVRIRGLVEWVSEEESDAYYASRPRGSRIGAWASQQSRPLESRFALEKAVAGYTAKYSVGYIPRPPYWHGYRVLPLSIEFWHDRPFRLHERIKFTRNTVDAKNSAWEKTRLYP
ncbi:pyridoxamine 5'-phosphate oxidase [Pseudochelatococcus sp. G4_1912]|uniref:pyridoxamine 5'-phosphate oxidase n=1 Tax=Pseudochelatococcus sp. G4_1912 TaxID=3114288 RepID=UPI0039C61C8F